MATLMRARVPYEVTILAADTQSGNRISNILYYKTVGGGAYGGPVASTDIATFLASVKARWLLMIDAIFSTHYVLVSFRARAIYGWKWATPFFAVVGATPSLTFTSITTGSPHDFSTGDAVTISETVGVTGLNAVFSPITVTGATTFTIPVALSGTLSLTGYVQRVAGQRDWDYVDNLEVTDSTAGGIPGECVPLAIAASCRRLNGGVGRNWRSHLSLGPIPEDDQQDGRFKDASYTTWQTNVDLLNNGEDCGGSNTAYPCVVSKSLGLIQPTPFTESTSWSQLTTDHTLRKVLGTCVSRKPKLTAVIA